MDKFDFDFWAKLHKENPKEFNNQRETLIKQTIASANPKIQQRLHGMQFQIDAIRAKSKNSYKSCIELFKLTLDKLYTLKAAFDGELPVTSNKNATILDFKKPESSSSTN